MDYQIMDVDIKSVGQVMSYVCTRSHKPVWRVILVQNDRTVIRQGLEYHQPTMERWTHIRYLQELEPYNPTMKKLPALQRPYTKSLTRLVVQAWPKGQTQYLNNNSWFGLRLKLDFQQCWECFGRGVFKMCVCGSDVVELWNLVYFTYTLPENNQLINFIPLWGLLYHIPYWRLPPRDNSGLPYNRCG